MTVLDGIRNRANAPAQITRNARAPAIMASVKLRPRLAVPGLGAGGVATSRESGAPQLLQFTFPAALTCPQFPHVTCFTAATEGAISAPEVRSLPSRRSE